MERWIDDRVNEYILKKKIGRKKALCKRRRPVNKKQHTSVTFNAKQKLEIYFRDPKNFFTNFFRN